MKNNQLIQFVNDSGVEQSTANNLQSKFLPFFEQAKEWEDKARALVVTDASQVEEMKQAREARLALKAIRVDADKTRKALKEDSLRYGKAVQGVYNVIEFLVKPIEKHLEEQETFVKRKEAERLANLKAEREVELEPFKEFAPYVSNLEALSDEDYSKLLNGAKLQYQQSVIDAKKEAERAEAVRKEREAEQERVRAENAQLKKEAEERERLAKIAHEASEKQRIEAEAARRAIQAKLEAEQAEKQRIIDEQNKAKALAEKQEAERVKAEQDRVKAELQAKAKAEAEAKAAPDKAKLEKLAQQIGGLEMPEVNSPECKDALNKASLLIQQAMNALRFS